MNMNTYITDRDFIKSYMNHAVLKISVKKIGSERNNKNNKNY